MPPAGIGAAIAIGGSVAWGFGYAALGKLLVVAGVSMFISNALVDSSSETDLKNSATYRSDFPRTTIQEGIPIAKSYGVCQLAGNIVRANDPSEDYFNAIITHCSGEIEGINSWKFNKIEYEDLVSESSNWKDYKTGTFTQTHMQKSESDFFDVQSCAYRGVVYTAVSLKKDSQINGTPNILIAGQMSLCEPIGGGVKTFSRNPAVIMWDFYRTIEGYEIADLSIPDFQSLEVLCDEFPAGAEGVPLRPVGPSNTTVKASSEHSDMFKAIYSTDIEKQIKGTHRHNQWLTEDNDGTNQCFNVDLSKTLILTKIVLINGHDNSAQTDLGIKNFILQGSNNSTAFDNTTYADDTNWTTISTNHVATEYDPDDPEKEYATNVTTTAYRYFRLKIADNHRGWGGMGFRDVSFTVRSPRYTFDYTFDNTVNINDAKKMIWKSFNGTCIRSQGKIKPVWEWNKEANGSGGLTARTSKHAFTLDNVVKNKFTKWKPSRYNVFTIRYLDTHRRFMKTSLIEKDDADIEKRNEVPFSETAYWITQEDTAKRRARQYLNKAIYTDYMCKLSGFSDSSDLELLDLVTITHTLGGWTDKEFIIIEKSEDAYGQPEFQLRAYYSGIYGDQEGGVPDSYFSRFQNPNDPPYPSSNISLSLVTPGSGICLNAVKVSFDAPAQDAFYSHTEIYASNDDTAYYLVGTSSGEDFIIQGLGSVYQIGDTCYVKLVNVNSSGVKEAMPDDYDASIVVTGAIVVSGGIILSDLEAGSNIDGQYIGNATITGDKIANATITATQIAAGTITANEIANATITATQIANATITGGKIASGTITGTNIGSATIGGTNIATATITATNIANATITGGKIASGTITGGNIGNAEVTGGKIAATTITAGNLGSQSVTAGKILNLTITASQIANLTITGGSGGKIAGSTLSEYNIVANTITATSIAADTITANQIAANTITANEILANTITASEIAATTITASELKGNAFGTLTITSGKIAINTTNALEIMAGGDIHILNGGDIVFDVATYEIRIDANYSSRYLGIYPSTSNQCSYFVGYDPDVGYKRFSYIYESSYNKTTIDSFDGSTSRARLVLDRSGGSVALEGTGSVDYMRVGTINADIVFDSAAKNLTLYGRSDSSWGRVILDGDASLLKAIFQAYNGTYYSGIYLVPSSRKIEINIDSSYGQVIPTHSNQYTFGNSSYYWEHVWCNTINWNVSNEWDHLDDIQVIKDMRPVKNKEGTNIINKHGGTVVDPDSLPDAFTNKGDLAADLSRQSGIEITDADLDAIRAGEKTVKWKETYMDNVYNEEKEEDELVEKEKEIVLDAQGIKDRTFFNARHMSELSIGAIKQLALRVETLETQINK